jgi:hypothetical protein
MPPLDETGAASHLEFVVAAGIPQQAKRAERKSQYEGT